VNWVPTKLDIPIILPAHDELVFTAAQLGTGLQPNEEELPNDEGGSAGGVSGATAAPAQEEYNEAALSLLESMGFPSVRCKKALKATGNSDADAAMEWLFAHMDDPGMYSLWIWRPILLSCV